MSQTSKSRHNASLLPQKTPPCRTRIQLPPELDVKTEMSPLLPELLGRGTAVGANQFGGSAPLLSLLLAGISSHPP